MTLKKNVLVTGGAGYIGSHTCIELLNSGYGVVVFDNFSNSYPETIRRIEKITGKSVILFRGDIRDQKSLEYSLERFGCSIVLHFAGLKAVSDSILRPLEYYDINVMGTLTLLRAMQAKGVEALVFSSSATVYGEPCTLPLTEDHSLTAINPYGRTKLIIEDMLRDFQASSPLMRIAILRYFNPVGAHESGLIGENPLGVPNNLMPIVAQVAVGLREVVNIWGSDYPTPDGTGIRDYIHVVDLAQGHLRALEVLERSEGLTVNLGTGVGYSVLEVIKAFSVASGRAIPYVLAPRRPGDVAVCFADPSRATTLLKWKAQRDLAAMCADTWRFQQANPKGLS
ncbi:UDP-glucose 4-epimerase GalE [Pararhodospirillum photometricum]|uniref:UDP-glucose 4-epimerase GalE n=1 Tax=Pararhodospirillum photometricum TaxID=1084 RepID=UPI0002E3E804|nr:UDP-glucose 4-epimerase GalE [Pararhodospirillum photometricum]